MRRYLLCALISGGLALTTQAQTPSQYDFVLNGPKAKASLQLHVGQIVYIDFWAAWCGPCRQSFPFMNALQKKYGKAGLKIIAISVDKNLEEAQLFLQQNPADFQIAFDPDGNVPKQYGVKGMPSSFLFGRDGKLLYSHKGFKVQDQETIEEQIKLALENKK